MARSHDMCYPHLDWPRDVIVDSKIINYQWSHDLYVYFLTCTKVLVTLVTLYPGITIYWRSWENTRSKRTRCETLDFAVFESSFIEDV